MLPGGMIFPEYRIICCKYLVHLNLSCCFLCKRRSLALADIQRVRRELDELGYYLQLPPPAENLLTLHRRQLEEPSA